MVALGRDAAIALALGTFLLLTGCSTTLSTRPVDRHAAITVDDFSAWLEPYGLKQLSEELTKQRVAGAYSLTYRYEGESEELYAIVNSDVMITSDESEAQSAFRSLNLGAKIGAGGKADLDAVATTLDWADEAHAYLMRSGEQIIGNLYVGRRANVVVMVVLAGAYSSDPALFEQVLEPSLWRLSHYDPAVAQPSLPGGASAPELAQHRHGVEVVLAQQ